MLTPKIEKIIVKYITKSATSKDLDTLSQWIKNPSNKKKFKDYVETHYAIIYSLNNPDSQKALESLLSRIRKEKSWLNKFNSGLLLRYAAAAILIGVLLTAYFYKDNKILDPIENATPIIVENQIDPGTDKATLTLENGESITLEKGTNYISKNVTSNGEEIVYSDSNNKSNKLVFNTLTVPRGGQFFIKLSDETKVWLNSETQLKYPVNFIEGETRQVELVYGEVYFDVSPSSMHKGSKFIVSNKAQEIEVIGTEFNIKAYRDEVNIYTTLVEGIVEISSGNQRQILEPNLQSNLNLLNNKISINKVDVNEETSWRNGLFTFRNKRLSDIMKVLSRWYDVNVLIENKALVDLTFKGVLGKNQDLKDILETLKSLSIIKNYEINGKQIILN